MGRPPTCCDKLINVKKGTWTEHEDSNLLALSKNGMGNWTSIMKKKGVNKCGKSCRPRWSSYMRASLKLETFTPEEEELIVRAHATIGSRWPIIAQQFPGRTDNDVKTYWNSKLKKKLQDMGIDPVTHRPFSQILADYGNIGGLPKSGMRIGISASLNKDLRNAMLLKSSEPYSSGLANLNNNNNNLVPITNIEPMQDKSNINFNNYQPYDLLTQLQAVKYVTEVSNSNIKPAPFLFNYCGEGSLSSSSSSTCSSGAVQDKSSMAFGWSDFLLEDAFSPTDRGAMPQGNIWDQGAVQDNSVESSSKDMFNQAQTVDVSMSGYGMSSSNEVEARGESSFVDAMVAKEKDLFMEFPELLLEEPFYY